jgi:hypothetical protein
MLLTMVLSSRAVDGFKGWVDECDQSGRCVRYGWIGGWAVCEVWADGWAEVEGKGGV